MEVALDYALQCSPDHPWVREHPEWFHHRPDGIIAYAENPPSSTRTSTRSTSGRPLESTGSALWNACKEILEYWIGHGVRDLPGRQPPHQAGCLLGVADHRRSRRGIPRCCSWPRRSPGPRSWPGWPRSVSVRATPTSPGGPTRRSRRPVGLPARSWPTGPTADYMRPNFWPNTPDILAGPLRIGPPAAFALRLVLAATLEPVVRDLQRLRAVRERARLGHQRGVPRLREVRDQGPGLQPADAPGPPDDRLNHIRRRHPAFAPSASHPLPPHDESASSPTRRSSDDGDDVVLVVVNLDPSRCPGGHAALDLERPRSPVGPPLDVYDELSGERYRGGARALRPARPRRPASPTRCDSADH